MRYINCDMKINLTLRVTGRRDDGYHNLVSVFIKIPSGERIFIKESDTESDIIETSGLDVKITGENIAAKVLRTVRELGVKIPPLYINIFKAVKPGSGLGSGSGNAAALIKWLASRYKDVDKNLWFEVARRTGADVPFLYSGFDAALVTGTGDNLAPLNININLKDIYVIIAFPEWSVGTREAYEALDNSVEFKNKKLDEAEAINELNFICGEIAAKRRVGLLPNDFFKFYLDCDSEYSGYKEIFKKFEDAGCLAWGLSGSGSAAFALSERDIDINLECGTYRVRCNDTACRRLNAPTAHAGDVSGHE